MDPLHCQVEEVVKCLRRRDELIREHPCFMFDNPAETLP